MILAAAMLDINHRIVLRAIVVTRRRIDHQRAPRLFHLTIIMYDAHLPMLYGLHLEVVHALLGNLDGT